MSIKTEIVRSDDDNGLQRAAEIIRRGGLVAFPTETVYGLGANALMEDAAAKVYAAKGRPSDNPLIVHLADASDANKYCYTTDLFEALAECFLPGPLTLILPKREVIPKGVTGGLDTVAIRVPSNPIANRLIRLSEVPIAAPSANLSGKPSCTTFAHVAEDMDGRIDMIIDGGNCQIGLESTILSLTGNRIVMLRPGGITGEMLEEKGFSVTLDKAVTEKLADNERPMAPGMKYRHYAPNAQVILLDGDDRTVEDFMHGYLNDPSVALIGFDEYSTLAGGSNVCLIGRECDQQTQANRLFDLLRSFDHRPDVKRVYCKLPDRHDLGLAIYNRMLKASGYQIQKL
ncbi:MAG: L-threonylcarbamoyladenylate synthase [Eubacteriales bacterium]